MDFVIQDTIGKGKGLFSLRKFEKGQVIFKFDGNPLSFKNPKDASERFLQVDNDIYLDLEKHFSVFTNHSCNPNTTVKIAIKNAFLIAIIPIDVGDEITFDYSLTSTETPESWSMKCNCSPFNCRKIISGFDLLNQSHKDAAIISGKVPGYILRNYK